ncbi:MATE family efflux transporter [Thiomicrorhabdus sp. 6S3-12]|uniref:MATE family efflux transporter n=1 Tax=Thiomicrorhabdus sp. 6S3-12 TaxID=2819681 RepID=UPI001FB60A93|nr:MATE family efflux transporter [Thiomicrorhabdus sp. 6S3-12]
MPASFFSISSPRFRQESKILLKLAFPILLAQLALTALGVVDTLMSGWSGTNDLAAIGLGSSIMLPVFIFGTGVLLAITPLVAKAFGRHDNESVSVFLAQGVVLALPIGLLSAFILNNMQPVLDLLELNSEVYRLTDEYLRYIAWGLPAIAFYQALRFYWEGLGQTLPTMWISFVALICNIPLNALFIYGGFGIDPMGAAGCGVASAIVMWLMLAAGLVYVYRNPNTCQHINWSHLLPKHWKQGGMPALKIGIPNAMALLFEVSLFTLIALFVAPLGATVLAGQQIAISVTSMAFMLPLSLSMALTVRIGQEYGRGDLNRLRQVMQVGYFYALMMGAFLALNTYFFRHELIGLYTEDPAVITVTITLLILAAIYQIFDSVQVSTAGILRGFHDTKVTMWVTFVSYWLIGIGLGYVLSFTNWITNPQGVVGFWLGICLGLAVAAVLLVWRLRYQLPFLYTEMQLSHVVTKGDYD